MRQSVGISLAMLLVYMTTFAQDHIPVPHTIPHGTSRICWGYAMGKAAGRSDTDPTCNPTTLIPDDNGISGTYFNQYDWSEINSRPLQSNDILYWPGTHAAYVTSVPHDGQGYVIVDSIGVAHMSASQWEGVIYEKLAQARSRVGVGNPSSFCRRKQVSITASNSFGGGNVKVAGSTVSSGSSVPVNWWTTVSLEALNQNYQNVYRIWTSWQKSGGSQTTENPRTIIAGSGDSYTANFSDWTDITFSNSFPGASGGTMSVWDTVRSAPGTVRMPLHTQFTISAINQEIDRISYTFSQWSGDTSSSNQTLSPTSWRHRSYTANFTPKPLPPDNVWAGGTVGDYVHVTWTEHPNQYVTQYQIWRRVKDNGVLGEPALIATVSHSTTSYIDYDFLITAGYTEDIVYYDVRSVFVVGQSTQYSDPYWTGGVFATNLIPRLGDGRLLQQAKVGGPREYAVSSHPNPFNPSTTISYQLVKDAQVELRVFDVVGREVASLVNEVKLAGYHSVQWNGRDSQGNQVASGLYLYRFTVSTMDGREAFRRPGKLLLTR